MYYIVYGLFYLVSLLPLWVLYGFSELAFFLLYRVMGYRKKVVMQNLQIVFPQKSDPELRRIARTFYRNFTDHFLEMLKLLSASKKFVRKHFVVDNPEIIHEIWKSGRRCQLHLGHNFNWELAGAAAPLEFEFPCLVVYMPVGNPLLERLILRLRSRTGAHFLSAKDMRKLIVPYRDRQYLLALVADQAPGDPGRAYWLPFFGKPTPLVRGPERGAVAGNIPAVFAEIYKTSRGRYRVRLEMGADCPAELPEGELTRRYVDFLEVSIRAHPDMWLWSHRRWKHPWKAQYQDLWIGRTPVPTPAS